MNTSKSPPIDVLVERAQAGDQAALGSIIEEIQDMVHRLSMRMLANPDDALDATQEVLILVVTKLSTFRSESRFSTWVYRVATNYLLTARKSLAREQGLTFDLFRKDLESGLVDETSASAEDKVMLNQLRVSCTMAMLLCLDLKHRIAYVLGDIFEFDHAEAAEILQISKVNFRKRLSRARKEVIAFTSTSCGLVNDSANCSCPRRLPAALAAGRISRDRTISDTDDLLNYDDVVATVKNLKAQRATLHLQTSMPSFSSPTDFAKEIEAIVNVK